MNAWEKLKEMRENQPSLGAELKAMAREAVKDVRQTLNETYFGQGEHAPEQGTPLNPTHFEVTKERETVHGSFREMIESRAQAQTQEQEMER